MMRRLALALSACVMLLGAAAPDDGSLSDALSGTSMRHMQMTSLRPSKTGDAARAATIVRAAAAVIARYPTLADAQAAGYRKFAPGVTLPVEHAIDEAAYAEESAGRLDPARPAAIIYERDTAGTRATAVMYVASADATPRELDAEVPLSVARWHRHVDLCLPPGDDRAAAFRPNGRFGFDGSIATASACREAGGRWVPRLFGWMVHVWPSRTEPFGAEDGARAMPGMRM